MNDVKVAEMFSRGETGRTRNLRSDGEGLFSYGTIIAKRFHENFLVETKYYSVTTRRHRRHFFRCVPENKIIYASGCHEENIGQYVIGKLQSILDKMVNSKRKGKLYGAGIVEAEAYFQQVKKWIPVKEQKKIISLIKTINNDKKVKALKFINLVQNGGGNK